VDINKIIGRAKSILLSPKTEWPNAAAEPDSVGGLYSGYIVVLAAIPAIVSFLTLSVIGSAANLLTGFRYGIVYSLAFTILSYVLGLVSVYISALVVDALAPSFSAEKNLVQALKAVAYSYTAVWVASIIGLVPGLGILAVIAGLIYTVYLLYLGLQYTMKCPADKAIGYTAVSIIVAIVLVWVVRVVTYGIVGVAGLGTAGAMGAFSHTTSSHQRDFAPGSYADSVDRAQKQLQAAQQSGDSNAQGAALGAMMSAALGGGNTKVEALAPDRIKPFIPDTLGGLPRKSIVVSRSGLVGMQVSSGTASYSDGAQHTLNLEITDTGSLKGLVGFAAGYAGTEQDTETDTGYEKIYKSGGQLVHEKWDNRRSSGEYGVIVGDRFSVKVSGAASSIGDLKSAVGSLNLGGLAALKAEGVQSN
jgi:hypothetical protein